MADNNWAAAVWLYVWSVADAGTYNSHGMSGDVYYGARVPSSQRPDVLAKLAQIRSEAGSITAGTSSGSGSLTFNVSAVNNYVGTMTAVNITPSNATGTVTLTNGIFTANGSPTITGVTNGMVLAVKGVPPQGVSDYQISGTGEFDGGAGWDGSIAVYESGAGQQHTAGPGQQATAHFTVAGSDPFARSDAFQPIVTSQVSSRYVARGESFTDGITFSTTADSTALNNPWHQNSSTGQYEVVTATAVLYGPFNSIPTPSASVPAGAPIAGYATVSTDPTSGPTISYQATAVDSSGNAVAAADSGYYTWVWSISGATQSVMTQFYVDSSYTFNDGFGLVPETNVSQMQVSAVSRVSQSSAGSGASLTDTFTVTLGDGLWLHGASGERIPLTYSDTAYFVPGAPAPAASSTIPSNAVALQTVQVVADHAGTYTTPAVTAPTYTSGEGYVVWQLRLLASEQPAQYAGFTPDWTDTFGLPAETTNITLPTYSTTALTVVTPGGSATDTLTVSGAWPSGLNAQAVWKVYKQTDSTVTPVCDSTTVVPDTSATAVSISSAGLFTSPTVTLTDLGTYDWVETVTDTATQAVLHQGVCGAASEITTVAAPVVQPARLASTGFDGLPLAGMAGGAVLFGGGALALTLVTGRRRRGKDAVKH